MGTGITLAPLAKLTVAHGYYGTEQPGIALVATAATQQRLARERCKLRQLGNGIEVYAGAPFGKTPTRPSGPGMVLSFWIEPTDPQLWTVTEPDWNGDVVKDCLFLSEKPAQDGQILSSSASILPVRPKSFHDRFDAVLAGKELSLTGWRGGDPVWTGPLPIAGLKTLDLPLHDIPDGRYRLQLDGTLLRDFLLTDRPPQSFWGMVEIDLGAAMPVANGQTPLSYEILFRPRQCRWRYVIRSLIRGRDLSGAWISAKPDTISFADPVPDPSGQPDQWIIMSQAPLPLYASPAAHHRFTLTLPAASGPAPAPISLPYPSADATQMRRSGTATEMWSTIYLTV